VAHGGETGQRKGALKMPPTRCAGVPTGLSMRLCGLKHASPFRTELSMPVFDDPPCPTAMLARHP
jgi:hypothetical protein